MIGKRKLTDHIIICGVNDTSMNIINSIEKYASRVKSHKAGYSAPHPYLVIDQDNDLLKTLKKKFDHFHSLAGDATDDDVLEEANIKEAFGIFPVLKHNKDNIFVTFTARRMNPKIRIVARTTDIFNINQKLKTAGADAVVSPNFIGGMRLASELVRPESVAMLDDFLRNRDLDLHFDELTIPVEDGGESQTPDEWKGHEIIRKTGAQIIAVKRFGSEEFLYSPPADVELHRGDCIVVLSNTEQSKQIQEILVGID